MKVPEFSERELVVSRTLPNYNGSDPVPVYSFPVTPREGVQALYKKEPMWQVMLGFGLETTIFSPRCIPDYIARAHVFDGAPAPVFTDMETNMDMFGREWIYEADISGSMVMPGNPLATDANDFEDRLVWPDIETWEWEANKELNQQYLATDNYYLLVFMNGYFERLISLMDFENALVALIDKNQTSAVQRFFDKLTDLYICIIDKVLQHFPEVNGISFHDDWGGEKNTFFSPETVAQMIVPPMRKLTDYMHGRGLDCDLHSCGNNQAQVENIIAAGWDSWTPQDINDTLALYDKYGDRIIIATIPEYYDPASTSEEQQRALARAYANHVARPEKPSAANLYGYINHPMYTTAFREELYRQSRINYSQ